jgi:hypothetical protein
MSLEIVMHEAFPREDIEAVRRLAHDYDESAKVSATYTTKAVDPVLIIMVIGGLVGQGFFTRAGEDAYEALKRFVLRLRAEVKAESQLVLEDDEGLRLILGPATPAEALLALPDDVREAAGEARELYWDEDEGRWKAPF